MDTNWKEPFFADAKRCWALGDACRAREGRPFNETTYHCSHFVAEVLTESGIPPLVFTDMPRMSMDHGLFHGRSPLMEFLLTHPQIRRHLRLLDESEPTLCGDLLAVRQHKSETHLAIADGDGWAWHLPRRGYVHVVPLNAHILPLVTARFRIYEEPIR